jgi:hypothetical protein
MSRRSSDVALTTGRTAVVLGASGRAIRGRGLHLPVIAALALGSTSIVTDSYGAQVLLAVTVVLACALQSAIDDPERSILEATPSSLARRALNRVAAAAVLVVPVWLVVAVTLGRRAHPIPPYALGLQVLTVWTMAVAVAMCVWRASASTTPSYVASPVLLGLVLVGQVLPPRWQMFNVQPWGPPWIAAHIRWCSLLLIAIALLVLLLSDEFARRPG